jgi:hypothetical protein
MLVTQSTTGSSRFLPPLQCFACIHLPNDQSSEFAFPQTGELLSNSLHFPNLKYLNEVRVFFARFGKEFKS